MDWTAIQNVQDYLKWLSASREQPYQRSLDEARRVISDIDLDQASRRSGAIYKPLPDNSGRGVFILPFLGQDYIIGYPGFKIVAAKTRREPSVYRQVILLHYLATVDDAHVPLGFVNLSGLPHGRPYQHALQKGVLEPLAHAYANDLNLFRLAAQRLGGRPLEVQGHKGLTFSFWPLPRLPMGLSVTPGDDELGAQAHLLVDLNAEKWLPIYDTAIVGRLLCQTLLRLRSSSGRAVGLTDVTTQDDGALYGSAIDPEHKS